MATNKQDQPSDARPLGRWERWTTDWDGEPIIEFDAEAHAKWCEKWAPPCPAGHPQRACRPLGFRERNVGELELRVALGRYDLGVGDVIFDERDDEVHVRVVVCCDYEQEPIPHFTDCPVRVWLERPLGDRAVIDVDSDEELMLFVPEYRDNVPQPDHGYHPANRRRQRGGGADAR